MRPKLLTPRFFILALLAATVFAVFVVWQQNGRKVIGFGGVPSTAGKLAWVRGNDIVWADGATGQNAVPLTTDNKGDDAEPAWSPDGNTLALTSNRNGVSRQIYIMDAAPGRAVAARTNSSSSKEAPIFDKQGDIYFLDGGRVAKLSPETADIDAVFPTAEQKRKALAELFSAGGVARFAVSSDNSRIFVVVKREQGEALVVYTDAGEVAVFGLAETILLRYLPDDSVVAVFAGGAPFAKPASLLNAEVAQNPEFAAPDLPLWTRSDENVVVKIGTDFAAQPVATLLFAPNGLAVSPDGSQATFTSTDKTHPGVFVAKLDGNDAGRVLTNLPASAPAFSPDGSRIAFVSGTDIYTVGQESANGAAPVNLTNGVGVNTAPAWSPAKPK